MSNRRVVRVRCARCDELIAPDEKWQLDHRDDGRGWLGPTYQRCNARAGWEAMVLANGNANTFPDEIPYRWPRRWYDEQPIGTEVLLGKGLVEVTSAAGSGRRSRRPAWLSWLSPRRRRGSQGDRLASRSSAAS